MLLTAQAPRYRFGMKKSICEEKRAWKIKLWRLKEKIKKAVKDHKRSQIHPKATMTGVKAFCKKLHNFAVYLKVVKDKGQHGGRMSWSRYQKEAYLLEMAKQWRFKVKRTAFGQK